MILLSAEVRQFIVDLYVNGKRTQAAIAELAGTTQSNVSKILAKARRCDSSIPACRRLPRGRAEKALVFQVSQLGSARCPLDMDML
jgi:predicted transcriptional regulator